MSDEWRAVLGAAVEQAAGYRESLETRPHAPALNYQQMRARVAAPTPERGMAPTSVLDELVTLCDPGLMSVAGPRFFGWVMGSSALPGVAADVMVSAWGQNAGYQGTAPAMAAIEEVAEGWLLDILDLPRESGIGFTTGATVANAICLAAARSRVLLDVGWDADADGLFGAPPITVLIGMDAHSSVFSALQLIGFGYNRVERIASDQQGRMDAEALKNALPLHPGTKIVIAQAGQVNTGAFDDFSAIVAACKAQGGWVHVDGAFGLWARAAASVKPLTTGIEGADSWVTDGHKWLQAPYDVGFAIVKDREAHQRAMNNWASYLPVVEAGDRVPSAFVPELSRRARGVPVWAMLKALGRQGVVELVERNIEEAQHLCDLLASEPGITVLNDVILNQVIAEFGTGDAASRKTATEAVIAAVQADGTLFAAGADWKGHWVMRLSVSNGDTTPADIDRAADAIIRLWRDVQKG